MPNDTERIVDSRVSATISDARWRIAATGPVEARDSSNVPVDCPIEDDAMASYIDYLEQRGLTDPEAEFDPCLECEFFRVKRLDGQGRDPKRDSGRWFDYGFCAAPARGGTFVLVNKRPVQGRARKVTDDNPDTTDEMVLACIDRGLTSVRLITEDTCLAERTVFKVIARLRKYGVLAENNPLRRVGVPRFEGVKVAVNG